jgi:hypothetical protein
VTSGAASAVDAPTYVCYFIFDSPDAELLVSLLPAQVHVRDAGSTLRHSCGWSRGIERTEVRRCGQRQPRIRLHGTAARVKPNALASAQQAPSALRSAGMWDHPESLRARA